MIVLDTNVISELMRPEPHPAVLAWVAAQPRATLYTTSINRAEVLYGVAALSPGRRRTAFEAVVAAIFAEELAGRVLPFDGAAAEQYARIVTARRADRGLRRADRRYGRRRRLRHRDARRRRVRGLRRRRHQPLAGCNVIGQDASTTGEGALGRSGRT